ncbi:MAG: hypothetical protein V3S40_10855, partial [Kiloniellales bacterium]
MSLLAAAGGLSAHPAPAAELGGPPFLEAQVAAGQLPPVSERAPDPPAVAKLDGKEQSLGHYGGTLNILMGRQKDIRMMMV